MEKTARYRDLLCEKNYIKNFCANMINRFGDSIDALAFAWMVYEVTGDRAWSALIFGLNALPTILLMPFAGVFVEKYDKRKVMIIADIGRMLLVLLVAILYMTGNIHPAILAVSTLLMSTFEAFRIPAGLSIYPKIIPREKYTVATSLGQSVSSIFVILGTGSFGFIVYTLGLQGAMFINAATFIISAIFISTIRLAKEEKTQTKMTINHYFSELKSGFKYFYNKKLIFLICIAGSFIGVALVPMDALKTPYITESLKLGELALSAMGIASLAGTMLGTILFPFINKKIGKAPLFITGGLIASTGYITFVLTSFVENVALTYVALAGFSFIVGIGMAFLQVIINVAFMENIESDYIGRVGSIFNSMASALMPVASFVTAGVATVLTVNQIFIIFGVISALVFILLAMNKLFRTIDLPKTSVKSVNTELEEAIK